MPRKTRSTPRRRTSRTDDRIDPTLLGELNATEISARELIAYSEECNRLVPKTADWRDSFVGTTAIAARLSNRNPAKAMALYARLTALASVTRDGARGWVREDRAPDGMAIVDETTFAAAAVEPLVRDSEGEFTFDRDSFLNRVLRLAKPECPIQ